MLRTLPRLVLALSAALLLSTAATAQVVPVNNTGCPNYVPPQVFGSPRLGQQIGFSLQRLPSPRSQVAIYPLLGGGRAAGRVVSG